MRHFLRFASAAIALSAAVCLVAPAYACAQFGLPSTFDIRQSNGFTVKISNVRGSVRNFTANAYTPGIGPGTVSGTVTTFREVHSLGSKGEIVFMIHWNPGHAGRYRGIIAPDGRVLLGKTQDVRFPRSEETKWTMPNLPCI